LAVQPVADQPGNRTEGRVDPHEGARDDAELHVAEPHLLAQQWEDGEDRLAVRVVEEADQPQHPYDRPWIPPAGRGPRAPPHPGQAPSTMGSPRSSAGSSTTWRTRVRSHV